MKLNDILKNLLIKGYSLHITRLHGKNLCVFGSSAARGVAPGEYLAAKPGMNLTKETVSGITMAGFAEDTYDQQLADVKKVNDKSSKVAHIRDFMELHSYDVLFENDYFSIFVPES